MWCRVGIVIRRRVTHSNDIWSFREPRDRLIAASLHELSSSLHFSIATRSLSVLLAFFAPLCVYIHFSLNNRLRQVSVVYYLCRYRKNSPENENIFTFTPNFRKFISEDNSRRLSNCVYLPGIFGCNNWHVGLIGELLGRRARERHYRSNILLRVCCYASHLKRHETKMRLVVV